jgi:hypothetical protein
MRITYRSVTYHVETERQIWMLLESLATLRALAAA